MSSDFLDRLDAAVDGHCACLCGRPITGLSPSAYFAAEACSDRYHWRIRIQAWQNRGMPPEVERVIRETVQNLTDGFRSFVEQLQQALDVFARALRRAGIGAEPAADPLERMLQARRERNTGPRPRPRPPKHIAPAGGWQTAALGRGAYRPR